MIVDRNNSIRYANAHALSALGSKRLLAADGKGQLVLSDRLADAQLKRGLAWLFRDGVVSMADIPLKGDDGAVVGTLSVFPANDTEPEQASLNWLFSPERLALLLLRETAAPIPVERIRTRFGLTGAEARLAARLATGEALEQAADTLGISRETARTQLKRIFLKTDTHRQGELVALLGKIWAGWSSDSTLRAQFGKIRCRPGE